MRTTFMMAFAIVASLQSSVAEAQNVDINQSPIGIITKKYISDMEKAIAYVVAHDFRAEENRAIELNDDKESDRISHEQYEARENLNNFIGQGKTVYLGNNKDELFTRLLSHSIKPTIHAEFINVNTGKKTKEEKTATAFFDKYKKRECQVDSVSITDVEVFGVDKISHEDGSVYYSEHINRSYKFRVKAGILEEYYKDMWDFNIEVLLGGQRYSDAKEYNAMIFFKDVHVTIWYQ